jgi:DNA-binding MarR family transcriptional regulator
MSNKQIKNNDMTLSVLSAVEADSRVTQRSLSNELGIALGLTNSYIKKCIDKGLVKIQQVPANRYAYYLTPMGFTEKSRLTAEYFKASFSFYKRAKNDLTNLMATCVKKKLCNIILSDASELAEIAIIISFSSDINLVGILGNSNLKNINGIPIKKNINSFNKYDLIIITNIQDSQSRYKELTQLVSKEKIIIPDVLKYKKGVNK